MPGGQATIRQPWRMAAAYLHAYPGAASPGQLDVWRRNQERWAAVVSMARQGVNSPLTSSAGRLFDAVAAILGVRDAVTYEGQAAIELEQLADPGTTAGSAWARRSPPPPGTSWAEAHRPRTLTERISNQMRAWFEGPWWCGLRAWWAGFLV
jgi:hydrogenase maturation protein HypF